MAGKQPWLLGICRIDTSAGAATVRSQSGMFQTAGTAAWSRVALGRYRCTLGVGTEVSNPLDPVPTNIHVTCEDTRTDRLLAAQVVRTSATVFDVTIFESVVGGAVALADPNTGFAVQISTSGPVGT